MVDFGAALHGSQVQIVQHNPLDLTPVKNKLAAYDGEIERMQEQVQSLEVTDESSKERAVAMGGQAHNLIKKIESARKYFVQDPKDFAKQVDQLAKKYKDLFSAIEREAKQKISAYHKRLEDERCEAERKRREAEEAERKRQEEAAKQGKEPEPAPDPVSEPPAQPEPERVTRTEHGAAHQRKVWTYEVTDESQIPREYLTIDHKKINRAVKDGARNIPGVNIYQESKTVFR